MKTGKVLISLLALVLAAVVAGPVYAHSPGGAIFTTLPDGSRVNFNIYDLKTDVYLDGGPGDGAPVGAAGLDDGTYVFQITEPSGKTLLSQDAAKCRQFTVSGGVITSTAPSDPACAHVTGIDADHGSIGAITVQMMPYADTPNPGGEYKAWIVTLNDFLLGCGVANALDLVDCGGVSGSKHGFIPSHSKTDNFKIKSEQSAEIDVQFFDSDGNQLDGQGIKWTDTLGASNKKWSLLTYWGTVHLAHIEALEDGIHEVEISNQPGCTIGRVKQNGKWLKTTGPQSFLVRINNGTKNNGINYYTVNFEVYCQ